MNPFTGSESRSSSRYSVSAARSSCSPLASLYSSSFTAFAICAARRSRAASDASTAYRSASAAASHTLNFPLSASARRARSSRRTSASSSGSSNMPSSELIVSSVDATRGSRSPPASAASARSSSGRLSNSSSDTHGARTLGGPRASRRASRARPSSASSTQIRSRPRCVEYFGGRAAASPHARLHLDRLPQRDGEAQRLVGGAAARRRAVLRHVALVGGARAQRGVARPEARRRTGGRQPALEDEAAADDDAVAVRIGLVDEEDARHVGARVAPHRLEQQVEGRRRRIGALREVAAAEARVAVALGQRRRVPLPRQRVEDAALALRERPHVEQHLHARRQLRRQRLLERELRLARNRQRQHRAAAVALEEDGRRRVVPAEAGDLEADEAARFDVGRG